MRPAAGLNIDAPIEDIFVNSRRMQQMLVRKRSPRRFQKRQQQGVLTFAQRDGFFIEVYQSTATTLEPPAIEPIPASFRIATLCRTCHLPPSQYGAGACEQFPVAELDSRSSAREICVGAFAQLLLI